MKFSVDPKIFAKFPGVEVGILVITGMDNRGTSEKILKLLRQEEKQQKERLTGVEFGNLPEIAVWRKIYKAFGSDPRAYSSSVEALLRRARGGKKPLPQINNLVDLYNFLSLKYHLPAGAEDLDKVAGDIELVFAQGNERGKYIGSDKEDTCYKGEVIYKDEEGFICRRWNWREADRTKIDFETKNAVLVIEKAPALEEEQFKLSLKEASDLLPKYLSGKVETFILDQSSNFFEIPFQTGSKAKKPAPVTLISPIVPITPIRPTPNLPPLFSSLSWESKDSLSYTLRQIIFKAVKEVVREKKVKFVDIHLEHPSNENYGDYSTNIAMVVASRLKAKPVKLAEKLAAELNKYLQSSQLVQSVQLGQSFFPLEKAEVAGPGFVNLWLRKDYLISQMQRVLESCDTDISTQKVIATTGLPLDNKKIMVEYTDPNPFKEFHIGHLYSNSVGESLTRIFAAVGAQVKRANYQGDVGMHVAKSIWGMRKKLKAQSSKFKAKEELKRLEKKSLAEKMRFLGQSYALGATVFEEDEKASQEIKDINYLVYILAQEYLKKTQDWEPQVDYRQYIHGKESSLEEARDLFEKGRSWSLAYFETIYKKLGTSFDYYYFESLVGEYGMKIVKEYLKKGVFEESKGAVVFRGEKLGLHTRVFINALGLPTYEAKELGLAFAKYKDFPYDLSFNVTGNEIKEYFKVLLAVLKEINPELGEKTTHIGHGMVRLPTGKMSSRTGKILTGEWLINEVVERVKKIIFQARKKPQKHLSGYFDREIKEIAQKVGVGAVKHSLLKQSIGENIEFSFDKSLSFDGDSGPYLMYTYARCKSVIRKASAKDKDTPGVAEDAKTPSRWPECLPAGRQGLLEGGEIGKDFHFNPEELALLRTLYRFPEVVVDSARNLSPNLICSFLFDLAQKYNLFYDKHSILNPEASRHLGGDQMGSPEVEESVTTSFRLSLTLATAAILKRGLYLLGIKTVERM